MTVSLHHADMREWLTAYDGPLFDAVVTDPPYHLTTGKRGGTGEASVNLNSPAGRSRISTGFMGKEWDGGDIAFQVETWRAIFDKLKPGAHLAAFGGTRTYHRMACAIEDAGFEIRDMLAWTYGSGFPKSLDVERAAAAITCLESGRHFARAIPKKDGLPGDHVCAPTPESEPLTGQGTALKPALEPICLARKPIEGTVAANVLAHGTGAINIDACRVDFAGAGDEAESKGKNRHADFGSGARENSVYSHEVRTRASQGNYNPPGRFPANLLHDGSDEVLAAFPDETGKSIGTLTGNIGYSGGAKGQGGGLVGFGDSGSAARFFYSAKAGSLDRIGSEHPTVKPVDVMRWLERLVTPPGGLILDPFAGSGTTGIAAIAEGFDCTLVELLADHAADIERKLAYLRGEGRSRVVEHTRRKVAAAEDPDDHGPLFR